MLYIALSSINVSTHFKSEIAKINVYPITLDIVLQWLPFRIGYLRKCTVTTFRLSSASGHVNINKAVIRILTFYDYYRNDIIKEYKWHFLPA